MVRQIDHLCYRFIVLGSYNSSCHCHSEQRETQNDPKTRTIMKRVSTGHNNIFFRAEDHSAMSRKTYICSLGQEAYKVYSVGHSNPIRASGLNEKLM